MSITITDWEKYQKAHARDARPQVTNEQRSEAIRAQQTLNHPGFALLQTRLATHRDRIAAESKSAEYTLAHRRGMTADEMHRLREDIAYCSGWLKALDIALEILPEAVKAGTDP